MRPYELYASAAFAVCCVLSACHAASDDPASVMSIEEGGGAGYRATAGREERGPADAGAGKSAGGAAGMPDADVAADAGQAGAIGEAGAAGSTSINPATAECDIDGGCASVCSDKGQMVTCAVESFQNDCEFEMFHDVPAAVTCGQAATVGIANCGLCGMVPVQVFFDGTYCWQGVPDCSLVLFNGKVFDPHAPISSSPVAH